ncbi:hypothetical protein N7468_009140 [Penicillium chermesinum]|uniref:Zn(2)-C6 fungal-type domain-containing protein n=1 Tax=Penicillium chermesinum TaxID=63820 RepID=A0A9W9TEP4_9EURO|nr:uncharacterized protein N7468_009140 [Penicillium chermesinum]KAJ5219936.1 hypothetical protein N7468_009140 [Penicillium chermesinum]KAJ6157395.1 hypothetical protein N7470_004987 [Penicillium chermesinum]
MPRRCHTKSRRGCVQCKERHVKCDENRPTCSLCVRRGLECIYVAPRPRRRPVSGSPKNTRSERSSSHASSSVADGFTRLPRLQEMRLFHHACSATLPSMAKDEVDRRFWESRIPKVATEHPYVMDGLLAVAALHIASIQVEDAGSWLETALTYQTHTTNGLRQDLAANPQNAEASFICSGLILIFVTAYPGICHDENPVDPLSEILTMRSILSGAAFLWLQIYHGQGISLDPWVTRDGSDRHLLSRASEDPALIKLHRTILERFRSLRPFVEGSPGPNMEIYRSTYQLLDESLDTWPSGQGSLAWPIRISEAFVGLVKQGEPMALIFILFHGLDLHLSSRKWFARDSGKRLVYSVIQTFNSIPCGIPPEFLGLVDWIRKAVEV